VRRTLPPSAEIEKKIDELLAGGAVAEGDEWPLSELARLGAKLVIQRAVGEEFDAFIGRARYERKPEAPPGKRNGSPMPPQSIAVRALPQLASLLQRAKAPQLDREPATHQPCSRRVRAGHLDTERASDD
jgi:hypothetical protein